MHLVGRRGCCRYQGWDLRGTPLVGITWGGHSLNLGMISGNGGTD